MEFLAGPCEHCESIRRESVRSSGREKLMPRLAEQASREEGPDKEHMRHR